MQNNESNKFERVMELFDAARSLQGTERDAFLAETCRDTPDILTEIRRLLAIHEQEVSPLDSPIDPQLALEKHSYEAALPKRIGSYRVIRQIGTGGMGRVFLAEQDKPRRNVALKIIHPGFFSRELHRRFELEAAVLAKLDHPGIAQIHEAGMFDDESRAQPFFAMEFVDGYPLHEFIKQRGLDLRQKLELAASICEAVHHAHQKGVVHRDLKPGNILVKKDGQPKILDFGVARATDFDLQVTTIQTGAGQLIGTLQYMSPEQVEGNTHWVDTRSDVYSLGMILYEILTGRLPYNLNGCSIAGAAKMIVESEPASLNSISRTLRGDLNTIVMKSLQKDPALRYQSASALASDIRRYLDDQPIEARPASTIYQLKKFATRNKALVSGVVIAFILISASAVAATMAMLRANDQADRARTMNRFLQSVLIAADTARSGDLRMVDVLHDTASRVDEEFADHPDLATDVHELLTLAYYNIGLYAESERHARRWLDGVESEVGLSHSESRAPRTYIAMSLRQQSRFEQAEEIIREVVEKSPQLHDAGALRARSVLGDVLSARGRYSEAETILRQTLAGAETNFGRSNRLTVRPLVLLARTLDNRAMFGNDDAEQKAALVDEAIQLYERVIEDEKQAELPLYDGLHARMRLADRYSAAGSIEAAKALATEALDIAETRFGDDHLQVAETAKTLGRVFYRGGDASKAAPQVIRAVSIHKARDENSIDTIVTMADSLPILDAAQEWNAALTYVEKLNERFGGDSSHGDFGLECRIWLPYLYTRLGQMEKATPLFDALLAVENDMDELRRARLHFARGVWCHENRKIDKAKHHFELALSLCGDKPHYWPRRSTVLAAIAALKGE